jgi:hypothetical protein
MPFFIRKSIRLGPFLRLNLSKSGLGLSAGVKGARVGVTPQGRVNLFAGRFGLYYRERLGQVGEARGRGGVLAFLLAVLAVVALVAVLTAP